MNYYKIFTYKGVIMKILLLLLLLICNAEEVKEELKETCDIIFEGESKKRIENKIKLSHINDEKIEGLGEDLLAYIWKKSEENNIPHTLILAIIGVESDYGRVKTNKNKNGTIDSGIAQINSRNISWLSELAGIKNVDPYNDYHSIDMMLALLDYERDYWRQKGYSEEDVFTLVVVSYNMGRGNAIKFVRRNGVVDSKYSKKVMKEKEWIESKIY
jgi:hypothetical protein